MSAPLVDAHAHWQGIEETNARRGIVTQYCITCMDEVGKAYPSPLPPSIGLHPWHAEEAALTAMEPLLHQSRVIGEIGLDNVWCAVPLAQQRSVFHRQLRIAQAEQKPIILHTKGMEKEIAQTLLGSTMPKLIHWYSAMEGLKAYLEQDCYFSVGPDWATNPAVQQVMEKVPAHRLLTETDGLSAVSWALDREVQVEEIRGVLQGEVRAMAHAKGLSEGVMQEIIWQNFRTWYGIG